MKLARAVDIQWELETRVKDLVSEAICFSSTSKDLDTKFGTLFAKYPHDLPVHVKAYIRGYYSALRDNLYRNHLFFAYEWEGKLYEKWEAYPEPLREYLRARPTGDLEIAHGHFWKGTEKPFFLGTK